MAESQDNPRDVFDENAAPADGATEAAERVIWSGSPSQIINLKAYTLCAVAGAGLIALWAAIVAFLPEGAQLGHFRWIFVAGLLVVVAVAFKKWLNVSTTIYELTTQRLRFRRGIIAKTTDELELYRVRDWTLHEPLLYRLFGLGTLTLITSDQTSPTVVLPALPDAHRVRECLRENVELMRERKHVRAVDFE
jgi:uncharacterized membrane protein YdbT with pleckstrin-like domain